MNLDLEHEFTMELEVLISQYISQGMDPGRVQDVMKQAIGGMFENMSEVDEE